MALKCWGSARFLNDVPSITTPLGSHLLDEVLVHRKVTRVVCQRELTQNDGDVSVNVTLKVNSYCCTIHRFIARCT